MEFLQIRESDLEQILTWRTSEFVTKYMYTDIEYNLKNQKEWYEKVQKNEHSYYWIVATKGKKFGLVSINDIDWKNKKATWAFYVGEPSLSMVAGLIGPHLYNFAFDNIGLNKLTGEVMAENEAVRKMHLKHGCREVGVYNEHIYKNGHYHDVYLYEMLASHWREVGEKYKKFVPKMIE
ncbi:MAG: UDP-4-amino-4,6-dideoxy-N-acetyl-beta-L-altrosamine N-acetyltransferase [Bacillaceae bacterium]|nr:UDP-4-amino-4,6-dideoxy-N-acetyl-beta-L-altrosamine N-acetyltransferase [Bacillaceae bacterium]